MLRLALVIVLLLLSLLCIFRAPALYLWYAAILVTEFPWVFMLCSVLVTVWCLNGDRYRTVTVVMSIASFFLFASPIVRAYAVASKIDKDMYAAFGESPSSTSEAHFSFVQMLTGIHTKQILPQSFTYSSIDSSSLILDFYAANAQGLRPCVIVVHGGSWAGGDNKQLPELNTYLARQGYHVASINYRLAPKYHSPAPVEDLETALHYLKHNAAQLYIDTNNFVLLGRSAGGQVVLVAPYVLKDPAIKGVINFYGPADMVWGYANPANPLVFNSCAVMETYLGGTYKQVPQQYVNSSAIEIATDNGVPVLTIHGVLDPLVAYEHSPRLDKKLKQHHTSHYLLTLPWATHGCDYTLNGPSGQLSTYAVMRFLKAVIK